MTLSSEPCESVKVPNTIVAYWAGDVGVLGKIWVSWGIRVAAMKLKGYHVDEKKYKTNFSWNRTWDEDESDTYVKDNKGTPEKAYQRLLEKRSQAKELYGTYFWGHGNRRGIGSKDGYIDQNNNQFPDFGEPKDFSYQLKYSSINLNYKMSIAVMMACFTNSGQNKLYAKNGKQWKGFNNVLAPVLPEVYLDWKMK